MVLIFAGTNFPEFEKNLISRMDRFQNFCVDKFSQIKSFDCSARWPVPTKYWYFLIYFREIIYLNISRRFYFHDSALLQNFEVLNFEKTTKNRENREN